MFRFGCAAYSGLTVRHAPVFARKADRANHKKYLYKSLWYKNVPLIIINGVLLYLLLPLLVVVIQNSKIKLWQFDFVKTSFVLVFLFVGIFFFWSMFLGIKLWKRIAESS